MKSENKTSKTKIQINKEKLPNCIFDIFKTVIFLFAIISVVFTFFIKDVTIDGESMKDTLFDGDRAITYKTFFTHRRWEILWLLTQTSKSEKSL